MLRCKREGLILSEGQAAVLLSDEEFRVAPDAVIPATTGKAGEVSLGKCRFVLYTIHENLFCFNFVTQWCFNILFFEKLFVIPIFRIWNIQIIIC